MMSFWLTCLVGYPRTSAPEPVSLQKRIRNERQLNRQMELNGAARGLKKQIAQWQNELQETKFVNSDKKYTTQ